MDNPNELSAKSPSPIIEDLTPVVVSSSRVGRAHKKPQRFHDFLPSSATPIPLHMRQPARQPTPLHVPSPQQSPDRTPEPELPPGQSVQTEPNSFGLYRVYAAVPSYDPEEDLSLDNVCDSHNLSVPQPAAPNPLSSFGIPTLNNTPEHFTEHSHTNSHAPFLNRSIFYLMSWFYSGSGMKSVAELDRLVQEVLLKDDFNVNELTGFKATAETKRMDASLEKKDGDFTGFDGWTESTVTVKLPAGNQQKGGSEETAPTFDLSGVWHRDFIEVIKSAWQDDASLAFHVKPYQLFYKPSPDEPPQRVYGEAYISDAFLEMDKEIRGLPAEPGCTLERVVTPIMLWSDSTHLANFGNASMWPIYGQFANQSKYTRAKPTAFASHHLAYIPSVCLTMITSIICT